MIKNHGICNIYNFYNLFFSRENSSKSPWSNQTKFKDIINKKLLEYVFQAFKVYDSCYAMKQRT